MFNCRLLGVPLLLAVFILVPALEVQAQKKKKNDTKKENAAPEDSAKLKAGVYTGTLKSVPGTGGTFILERETTKLAPAKGGKGTKNNNTNRIVQLQNQIAQAQRQALTARTAQQKLQAANRLAQLQNQLRNALVQAQGGTGKGGKGNYQVVKQDTEFQVTDAIKVRTMLLPETFDDKGNIKKYSKKELADLKGKDKNLEGYESSLDKLEAGQKVKLILAVAPKKPAAKDLDKDEDDKPKDKKMQVTRIVILEEGTPPATKGKGKAKKKK